MINKLEVIEILSAYFSFIETLNLGLFISVGDRKTTL